MSPLARGVRTFAHLMVGVLTAAAVVDWASGGPDVKLAATRVTLGVIAAALGGLIAYLQAVIPVLPTAGTPWGKAIATFVQGLAAGLATVGLADLTGAAAIVFAHQVVSIVVASAFAALVTLAQNSAEQQVPTQP